MRLKDTQLLFRAAIRDGDTEQRALTNERFHSIMGEMADNEFLMPSLRRLLIDHTRIGMTFYSPRNADLAAQRATAVQQHDQFIELIDAGDAEALRRAIDSALGTVPRSDREFRRAGNLFRSAGTGA